MIGKLKGLVDSVGEDHLLLDVNGVGYLVYLSSRALQQLNEPQEVVSLYIETHVREDHIHLFGFLTASEKSWFNLLCTVQGVGAKMALGIQSSFSPSELVQAIHARDSKMLTRANGVGPKLGERLVTELKNKVDSMPLSDSAPMPTHSGQPHKAKPAAAIPANDSGTAEQAVSALANLGYGRSEAYQAVSAQMQAQPEIELSELIRLSLQRMSA